jgi:hypothetical protein
MSNGYDPAAPKRREPVATHDARLTIVNEKDALLRSRDGGFSISVSLATMRKRFAPGEQPRGCFRVELYADGVVEIGERLPLGKCW